MSILFARDECELEDVGPVDVLEVEANSDVINSVENDVAVEVLDDTGIEVSVDNVDKDVAMEVLDETEIEDFVDNVDKDVTAFDDTDLEVTVDDVIDDMELTEDEVKKVVGNTNVVEVSVTVVTDVVDDDVSISTSDKVAEGDEDDPASSLS
ncbi:hypothetical protein BDQ17DRAFT_1371097 [Cyathus striatus]|nr:hypothetical protein BDQ17DRAFT_1371097 [Cyathus striatus]